MAVLKILTYPEKSLSQPSVKVNNADGNGIDDDLKKLIADMGETMFNAPGVGLAAPQIGVNKRILVYDSKAANPDDDGSKQEFTALINPEIIAASGSIVSEKEACLSVLEYSADVKRYKKVTVKALNIEGIKIEFDAEGILAVIMQHEIDHLDGILFIDRISVLKRAMYKKKIKKNLMISEEQDKYHIHGNT
ncbi:peptide deformylase [Desulfobacula sp.]|uniref:peptide deformylase n=1 Tax=Desulfobacula sp. TaxID=2593537 RepID=UPI0025BF6594|nr:peptide deformylase [Desulfobacula sp.]MBC2705572.1 peptide deformylase [Desulfobacula sp.]